MKKNIYVLIALIVYSLSSKAQTITQVSTIAGGFTGYLPETYADEAFGNPQGVCTDTSGNIYVVDYNNFTVYKISPSGVVSTFAGRYHIGNVNGVGKAASFRHLLGICIDPAGSIYVSTRSQIRKISPTGEVSFFVGDENRDFADGKGAAARFDMPNGLCSDKAGNIYVADTYNHRIRKISPAGDVTTFAGSKISGNLNGTGKNALFNEPHGICSDAAGNIYVSDFGNHNIRKITPEGVVTTLAGIGAEGSSDGPGAIASFHGPAGLCCDSAGYIYVADYYNNTIRKISPSGEVLTLAGNWEGDEDGVGRIARFFGPKGICIDTAGNILVADFFNHKIRKIEEVTPAPPKVNYVNLPASVCMGSTVDAPSNTQGNYPVVNNTTTILNIISPKAICRNNNSVYILNSAKDAFDNIADTIRQYSLAGTLTNTIPLNSINNQLITADNNGNIYASYPDINNPSVSNIRKISPNGFDDFSFSIPSYVLDSILAIEFGPDGFLYVSEKSSGYIRKIDAATGNVTNLPDPNPQYSFYNVVDIAFDKNGDMYLADMGHNKILKRNSSDNNYYPAVSGLDTIAPQTNSFSIDPEGNGHFLLSSSTTQRPILYMQGSAPYAVIDSIFYTNELNIAKPLASLIAFSNTTNLPAVWALDPTNNQVKVSIVYAYTITPKLPEGLSYNILTGEILGKAVAPSPLTTYTVTIWGNNNTSNTSTFTFEVAPSGGLSNTPGTSTATANHKDGLTVKYFSPNNCNKMIEIADALGGTKLEKVEVKETVSNLATFGTGKFIGRVTDINTSDPNASAVIRLFFTNQDITNYNASNGTGEDLDNNTALGTMTVAVLQLHKKEDGHIEQIKHNPLTAKWISAENVWQVDVPVSKFSKFYTGPSSVVNTIDCANTGTLNVTSCSGVYSSPSGLHTYTTSGTYLDTLVNQSGCDSIVTIYLTLNGSSSNKIVSACGSYTWNGKPITYIGTSAYLDTIPNNYGCDSLMRLEVTLYANPTLSVNLNGETLTSNDSTAINYQWINCAGNTIINGATGKSYTATANGSYAVIVTSPDNCSDTSACIAVTKTGITPISLSNEINLFPNPTNGDFTIKTTEKIYIEINSSLGEIILAKEIPIGSSSVDLSNYAKGVYFIKINSKEKTQIRKIIVQ